MISTSTIKKIKSLEIKTRHVVESMLAGGYQSAFKGRGLNFSDIRPYQVGDDVRFIDWKVTAKMNGTPYVKLFQEERELTVFLMVDISGSQDFGGKGLSKKDVAIELAAALGFSAIRNQDNVGLILFSDRIEQYVPPKKGKSHVLRLIRDLFVACPVGKGTNIAEALQYLLKVQRKKAVVFVISDFLSDGYQKVMGIAASRHDVVPVVVRDDYEAGLPSVGIVAMEDAETGAISYVFTGDKRVRELLSNKAKQEEAQLDYFFHAKRVTPLFVSTSGSTVDSLIRFFKKRASMR